MCSNSLFFEQILLTHAIYSIIYKHMYLHFFDYISFKRIYIWILKGLDNSIVNYDFWILKNKRIFFQNIYQKISFICDQLILHSNNSMFNFRISFIIKCSSYHFKFRKTVEYFSNPSYIFICGSLYVHVPGKWHFIVPSFFVIFSNKRNNNGQVFLKNVLIFSYNTWFC